MITMDKALKNIRKTEDQTKKSSKGMLSSLSKLKAGWDKNQIVQHIVETTKDVLLYLSKKIEN